MVDAIVKRHQSPTEWCKAQMAKYVEFARQIWITNGEKYENLHKDVMMTEIKSFFDSDTIKPIISELGYYYYYLYSYTYIYTFHYYISY